MKKVLIGIKGLPTTYKYSLIFLCLMLLTITFVYPILKIQKDNSVENIKEEIITECRLNYSNLMSKLEAKASSFPGEVGIFIKDLKTNHTIGINQTKLFPSASLVKVPIMAAIYQAQKEGKINLNDKIKMERKYKARGCGKLYYARCGRTFTVRELVEKMITESDNTAANMLVEALGFGYINQKFVEFGLIDTDLRRGIMDLKWRKYGIENYTTAQDMAILLERMYSGTLVSQSASEEMLAILKKQKINDRIPRNLPRSLVVAHKTGLLRGTVSDVGIVFTNKGNFIICVLTSDIRSYRVAKRFISRVAAYTYKECYSKS